MAQIIEMPKLSDTMTVGTLVKWLQPEGATVKSGDLLAEVETDKATMELESFFDGVLLKHFVAVGLRCRSERPSAPSAKKAKSSRPRRWRSNRKAETGDRRVRPKNWRQRARQRPPPRRPHLIQFQVSALRSRLHRPHRAGGCKNRRVSPEDRKSKPRWRPRRRPFPLRFQVSALRLGNAW